MSRSIWMQAVSALLLSGCAATSTMVGVREPDLSQIKPADQRSHVERILGDRLWRAGSDDTFTYDIYEYKEARSPRPVFGATWLSLDFLSFGFMPSARGIDEYSWPVKQIAVAYDGQDRVHSISQPWSVHEGPPCRRMRIHLPANAGVPSTVRPSSPTSASAAEAAVIKIDWLLGMAVEVDGRHPDGRVVGLPAGFHNVNGADVELLSGRVYRWTSERFTVGYRDYLRVFWIEDVESGETLHCWQRSD